MYRTGKTDFYHLSELMAFSSLKADGIVSFSSPTANSDFALTISGYNLRQDDRTETSCSYRSNTGCFFKFDLGVSKYVTDIVYFGYVQYPTE